LPSRIVVLDEDCHDPTGIVVEVYDWHAPVPCQPMARGKLITIEGLDGAGKSTLAAALVRELAGRGLEVRLLREPGGVEVSERIRALVKDPALTIHPRTEALLYAAARAELVHEVLAPALAEGALVLLDRFLDSSLAYQGAGRELGIEQVRAVNLFATAGLQADRTLLLRIDPAAGRARAEDRGAAPDRLEREGERFFTAIAAAYDELARAEPQRIRAIDATLPPGEVLREALAALEDLLLAPAPGD
jgi:dTMP kinase